jgi:hypothetical protein
MDSTQIILILLCEEKNHINLSSEISVVDTSLIAFQVAGGGDGL